ncbi:MAG: diacylglycerol kinase family protein [Bacteroidota bacterium]
MKRWRTVSLVFIIDRFKSVGYALKGIVEVVRTEANFQVQIIVSTIVIAAGFYFDLTKIEWILQLFCIGLVLGVESLNTAIERLSDKVSPDFDPQIGKVKDLSAGAVLLVSITAIIVGLLIYLPKIF